MKVFITGSSKGFGFYMALSFFKKGWEVICNGRRKPTSFFKDMGMEYHLADAYSISSYHLSLYSPDVIINNAYDFKEPLRSGLGQIYFLMESVKYFETIGKGIIINVNSVAGLIADQNNPEYCSSKWGLRGYSEAIKHGLRMKGINIIDIYPGKMNAGVNEGSTDKLINAVELADFIVSLCDIKSFVVSTIHFNKTK